MLRLWLVGKGGLAILTSRPVALSMADQQISAADAARSTIMVPTTSDQHTMHQLTMAGQIGRPALTLTARAAIYVVPAALSHCGPALGIALVRFIR